MSGVRTKRQEMAKNTKESKIVEAIIPAEEKALTFEMMQLRVGPICDPIRENGRLMAQASTPSQANVKNEMTMRFPLNTAAIRRRKRREVAGMAKA